MAPNDGHVRALYADEQGLPLGTRLADGHVVVSAQVAHAVQVGQRELNRRERRRMARGKPLD